jgi:type 1 fimbria pilin
MQICCLCTFLTNWAPSRVVYCLLLLLGTVGFHGAALAANGEACMPFGYGTNAGTLPSTNSFVATTRVSTKKLLYQRTWTPTQSNVGCTTDENARFFIYPDFSGTIFKNPYRRRAEGSGNQVKVIFESDDDQTGFGINESLFTLIYTTTMACSSGGLSVMPDQDNRGFVIYGINSRTRCNGNYVVTYDIQVWQAATTSFPSMGMSQTLGVPGFKQQHYLQDGTGAKIYSRGGTLIGSETYSFVAKVGCSVSISSSSITLPTYRIPSILDNPSGSATPFEVSLTNCQTGSGAPSVWLTWRFTAAHPTDSKALLNSDSGSSPARNIALNMYFVDQNSIKKPISHQVPLDTGYKLDSPSKVLRHFVQYGVTPEGRADKQSIQPGRLSGQAQLFVQYQ